jgi:hypothetical protein
MSATLKPHAAHRATAGSILATTGNLRMAIVEGTTVPSDGATGYATGCLFLHTDGAAATSVYINEGSVTSADFNPVSTGGGIDLNGLTATAAEINAAADVSGRIVNVTDAATYTVLAANSGKPHIMPNFTSTCTLALPTAAAGLEYEFYGKAVAVDAQNWVFDTGAAANFYLGSLIFLDTDDPADTVTTGVFPNGSTNDILTIVTPAGGTRVKLICVGTNWIVGGVVVSATTPAFSDT